MKTIKGWFSIHISVQKHLLYIKSSMNKFQTARGFLIKNGKAGICRP